MGGYEQRTGTGNDEDTGTATYSSPKPLILTCSCNMLLQYQCFFNRFISFSSIQIPIRYTIYCQELLCLIGNCFWYHWESTPGNLAKCSCSPNIATTTRTCVSLDKKYQQMHHRLVYRSPPRKALAKLALATGM